MKYRPAEDRDDGACSVVRCKRPAAVIDATRTRDPDELPLCDRHWPHPEKHDANTERP